MDAEDNEAEVAKDKLFDFFLRALLRLGYETPFFGKSESRIPG
ncbi:MAG TPA: hypothetical protein PKV41_06000 [Candidatus Omnitrophota bacterium]|nr:hypothetical protein [Candidatus Omnitrophota bacterium]